MVGASLLFAVMGLCVKLASDRYGAGEWVMYRSLVGLLVMATVLRWRGLVGLASGLIAAVAYLQVGALGRIGEAGERVVLYFSATGVVFGATIAAFGGGFNDHAVGGAALLLAIVLIVAAGVAATLLRPREVLGAPTER